MYLITSILAILPSFLLFTYICYKDYSSWYIRVKMEEEEIFHQFHGDPEKIRFYKGFKKFFDGDLSIEELEQWFEKHPSKTKPA